MELGWAKILSIFIALFAIIDPFGAIPLFLALTKDAPTAQKRRTAAKSCGFALVVLVIFVFAGKYILDFFGVSITAFQVGGGVIIFMAGLPMLFAYPLGMKSKEAEVAESAERGEVSLVPLAVPMLAGPGAITTVVVLAEQYKIFVSKLAVLGSAFLVLLLTLALFWEAERLFKMVGQTGLNLLTRIMGLILIVLAVQYILSGVKQFFGL
jgi:multiple antibiotic resistance protein